MRWKWCIASLLLVLAAGAAQAQRYTYVDLVRQLSDLERLAKLPVAGEKCQQWSSYDRASRYDEATGKYINWDANGDGGGIIRTEGDQQVMAEMDGPGVIWRTWSAAPGKGHVRIYLDGAKEPQVDLPFDGYFNLMNAPFDYPALVHDASSGKNLYVPIPFQKSCKITADKDWGAYYHFTYTTYPKTVQVPTFTRNLAPEERDALADVDRAIRTKLGEDPAGKRKGEATVSRGVRVGGGKAVTVADLKGPRAITAIRVSGNWGTREEQAAALRELALRITWDNDAKPAVWAPLGDFFGTAPGINPYRSLPMGMSEHEFYSLWYMPFGSRAKVEIVNDGTVRRDLKVTLVHAPLTAPVDELGRFHAKWHRDVSRPTDPGRNIEWTLLKTKGSGRYCGVALHVWNPKGGWWGEGDEMFYVDGEKFPSTFGTGSEDFFGYAWCNPTPFQNAFHNQPFNSGDNKGHASVNRWQIADNVPFHTSFEGTIEKYFPNDRPTLYAATIYWYETVGGGDPYEAAPMSERQGYFLLDPPPAFKVEGALEGESLEVEEKTAGKTESQILTGFGNGWSNDHHLWWTDAGVGDRLVFRIPVDKAGRYDVRMQLTKAPDYGIVQVTLDGARVGDPVDLYDPTVKPSGEVSLGTFTLTKGNHKLGFEITGANPKAKPSHMVGFDYVKLVAVK